MKTKNKFLLLFGLFLSVTLPKLTFGQTCSYNVHNDMNCMVTVQVDYYDGSNICNTVSSPIPANSSLNFNCGSCGTLVNIVVTLVDIGGTPNGTSDDISNNGVDISAGTSSCSPSGNINMNWASSDLAIHP